MARVKRDSAEIKAAVRRLIERRTEIFSTIVEAAKASGVNYNTWKGYEHRNPNRPRDISPVHLMKVAQALKTTPEWLVYGRGPKTIPEKTDERHTLIPVIGYIGAGALVEPEYEQVPPEGFEDISIPFLIEQDDVVAFMVRGESMLPAYQDGHAVIVYRERRAPVRQYIGEVVAVKTADGQRYVKTLKPGRVRNRYALQSFNATDIENVEIDWLGEIVCAIPARQVRVVRR